MSISTLENFNRAELIRKLGHDEWIVACLCAAWCDVCRQYEPGFRELASQFPAVHFVWVDIEDQSDLVEDFDVDNFPTLLIQKGDTVAFFGTVQPELRQAGRLLTAQMEKTAEDLNAEAASSPERLTWQLKLNLRARLKESLSD